MNKYVLKNCNVLPIVDDVILYDYDIVVENNKIKNIEKNQNQSYDCTVYDCKDKYVMPGLIDTHIHLFGKEILDMCLVYGVTSVLNMSAIEQSNDWIKFYKSVKENKGLNPRVMSTGPILDSYPLYSITKTIKTTDEAKKAVEDVKNSNYDFIKIYNNLTYDCYNTITLHASKLNIEVIGHLNDCINPYFNPNGVKTYSIEKIKQKSVEHIVFIDDSNIELLINSQTRLNPTLYIEYIMQNKNDNELQVKLSELSPQLLYSWMEVAKEHGKQRNDFNKFKRPPYEVMLKTLAKYKEMGGELIMGTDTGMPYVIPGYSLHKEMQQFSKAGFSNYEILKIATLHNAQHLNNDNMLGTIEIDKLADLLILNSNPLEDINNTLDINSVVIDGNYLNGDHLNKIKQNKSKENFLLSM